MKYEKIYKLQIQINNEWETINTFNTRCSAEEELCWQQLDDEKQGEVNEYQIVEVDY